MKRLPWQLWSSANYDYNAMDSLVSAWSLSMYMYSRQPGTNSPWDSLGCFVGGEPCKEKMITVWAGNLQSTPTRMYCTWIDSIRETIPFPLLCQSPVAKLGWLQCFLRNLTCFCGFCWWERDAKAHVQACVKFMYVSRLLCFHGCELCGYHLYMPHTKSDCLYVFQNLQCFFRTKVFV